MAQEGQNDYLGRKRALVLSISEYDKLQDLDFCTKDGNKMYEVLTELGYEIPVMYALLGGRVEYWKIHDAIIHFFYDRTISPKDTILFYFSGHGVLGEDGEHYLSSSEIDPDVPQGRGFSFDDLSRARDNCNSKTIFTILDCCYSGAQRLGGKGDGKSEDESATVAKRILQNKSKMLGEGQCILTACKPMQKAYESKEHGHSFFTLYLTEGLYSRECVDENGDVTPELLNRYVDYRIRSLPENTRPKQTPFLNCQTAGKIVIAHRPELVPDKQHDSQINEEYLLKLLLHSKIEEFNMIRQRNGYTELFFAGANLASLNLVKVDLQKVYLANADLSKTDLGGANLSQANLTSAYLRETNLIGAKLIEANFNHANLYHANLSQANLTKAYFRKTILIGTKLVRANLAWANLSKANLVGADLSYANLKETDVTEANLSFSILTNIKNFPSAILEGANLTDADKLPISKGEARSKGAKIDYFLR